jgi:hypothetical protein
MLSIADLGNLGDFLSSIAVLVSLIYLAVQIKHGTDAARTSTYQAIVAEFGALNRAMAATPDLSMLFVSGMEDFASLKADEKARISQLFFVCFHNFENMYYQYRKGYLEDDVWLGWKRLMLTYYSRAGFQTWWAIRSDVYSSSFAEFLRSEKLDKPVASYFDVTQAKRSSR